MAGLDPHKGTNAKRPNPPKLSAACSKHNCYRCYVLSCTCPHHDKSIEKLLANTLDRNKHRT